jgi:hypothetical protein
VARVALCDSGDDVRWAGVTDVDLERVLQHLRRRGKVRSNSILWEEELRWRSPWSGDSGSKSADSSEAGAGSNVGVDRRQGGGGVVLCAWRREEKGCRETFSPVATGTLYSRYRGGGGGVRLWRCCMVGRGGGSTSAQHGWQLMWHCCSIQRLGRGGRWYVGPRHSNGWRLLVLIQIWNLNEFKLNSTLNYPKRTFPGLISLKNMVVKYLKKGKNFSIGTSLDSKWIWN